MSHDKPNGVSRRPQGPEYVDPSVPLSRAEQRAELAAKLRSWDRRQLKRRASAELLAEAHEGAAARLRREVEERRIAERGRK